MKERSDSAGINDLFYIGFERIFDSDDCVICRALMISVEVASPPNPEEAA